MPSSPTVARRLREARRPAARVAALRRALGAAVARPRPLRRHQRLREGPPALDLAVPRLGHPARSTPTCRSTSSRSSSSPATCCPNATLDQTRRDRLPPQHDAQRGGRHRPAGVPLPRRWPTASRRPAPSGSASRSAAPSATRTSSTRSRTASTTGCSRSSTTPTSRSWSCPRPRSRRSESEIEKRRFARLEAAREKRAAVAEDGEGVRRVASRPAEGRDGRGRSLARRRWTAG